MNYTKDDIFANLQSTDIILQVVNNKGAYGRGFSGEISRHFPLVETIYRLNYKVYKAELEASSSSYRLLQGCVMPVYTNTCWVVSMVAQDGYAKYKHQEGHCFLNYDWLNDALRAVKDIFIENELYDYYYVGKFADTKLNSLFEDDVYNFRLPYNMGCGLAGGDWNKVSALVDKILGDRATVYEL